MLLVAEGLETGQWSNDLPVVASAHASQMGGAQVFLKEGETHPLGRLMSVVAVASANDGAMAVAEGLWGSEQRYLVRMNERAKELGMIDTTFNSVHGLPPNNGIDHDRTTARDMAILAQWCVRKPGVLEWTRQQELQFRPGNAVKYNTNKLLWRMKDCDGLKTGFTRAAGFCLTATAARNGVRLIAVVMGHDSKYGRFNLAEKLLEDGFRELRRFRYLAKGQPVGGPVPVHNCVTEEVRLVTAEEVWITVRERDKHRLALVARRPERLDAPVRNGARVGEAHVRLAGQTVATVGLVSPRDLDAAGWRWKLERGALRRY